MTDPSAADVASFRLAVARSMGLRIDDERVPEAATLLARRAEGTRARSLGDYVSSLSATADEVAELARELTVSETYFLRHAGHFLTLADALATRVAEGRGPAKVLVAGCSSGEEVYSVALTALDVAGEGCATVLGVDVNPDVLAKAESGSYTEWSLRAMSPGARARWLRPSGRGFEVDAALRRVVRFERFNLLAADGGPWREGGFDFVFCRNVLMYFSAAAARRVVGAIARAMPPGGYLFLGHAEHLRGLSDDFDVAEAHDAFHYRRRPSPPAGRAARRALAADVTGGAADPLPTAVPGEVAWLHAIETSTRKIDELRARSAPTASSRPAPAREADAPVVPRALALMRQERFHQALEAVTAALPEEDADALLVRAALGLATGDVAAAEGAARALLGRDGLHAGAHYVVAICREHAGDLAGAEHHARAAGHLDPTFALPHLQLGRLARRGGDPRSARRALERAADLLPAEDSTRIVLFGGGFTRDALTNLCRLELSACEAAP